MNILCIKSPYERYFKPSCLSSKCERLAISSRKGGEECTDMFFCAFLQVFLFEGVMKVNYRLHRFCKGAIFLWFYY